MLKKFPKITADATKQVENRAKKQVTRGNNQERLSLAPLTAEDSAQENAGRRAAQRVAARKHGAASEAQESQEAARMTA
jgi:hypothetical protein